MKQAASPASSASPKWNRLLVVGVVADHSHGGHLLRAREHARDRRAAGDELSIGRLERRALRTLAPASGVDDGPDAHRAVVQWNVPAPAFRVRRREDVVAVRSFHARGVGVVAPERQILEERVEVAQALAPSEERVLAARVDDVGRFEPQRPAVLAARAHDERPFAVDRLDRECPRVPRHPPARRGARGSRRTLRARRGTRACTPPGSSWNQKLHGSALEPQTKVPPGLRTKPAASTAGSTPTCFRIGSVAERSDSPMW